MKIVDQFLDELRRQNITEIARKSGLGVNTLYGWLHYGREPSLANAQRVAVAMGKIFLLFDIQEDDEP